MAKKSSADAAESSGGHAAQGPGLAISLAISLVVGVAAGAVYGFMVPQSAAPPATATLAPEVHGKDNEKKSTLPKGRRFPKDAVEIAIPSIITTIGSDQATNVRLDLSMVAVSGTALETPLRNEIREDVIALLRGLKREDLEGGRGFLNLRAQLDERARIRGRGAILGLLIGGLMVQ
jgi:flagellar protein FliL